jgi:hypothetical protein
MAVPSSASAFPFVDSGREFAIDIDETSVRVCRVEFPSSNAFGECEPGGAGIVQRMRSHVEASAGIFEPILIALFRDADEQVSFMTIARGPESGIRSSSLSPRSSGSKASKSPTR